MIVFNKSITQGIFPDVMKLADVIPLYKGKEKDEVINYRPISLLMILSKILKKSSTKEYTATWTKTTSCMKASMASVINAVVNKQ